MRYLLPVGLCLLLPGFSFGQETKGLQPIKVIVLDRKDPVLYEKDVEPILINKCAFCHSGNQKEGKLDMATYETLMKGGKKGKSIVPGKSAESLLIRLCGKTEKPAMPPKSEEPLTPQELALIKLWVNQGAKPPTSVREKPRIIVSAPPAAVQPVRGIAISPDKSSVAASRGNQIHIYDASSGTYIRSLVDPQLTTPDKKPLKASHLSLVESLAYSPDGKWLASGAFQEVILWDALTGQLRHRLTNFAERVVAVSFSPDSKLLAVGGGAPTEDGEIKIVDVPTGKVVTDIKNGHSDTVFGVCFSPDGKMLATCGGRQVRQGVRGPQRQVHQVVRGPYASRPRRRLEGGRQAAGQRRRRQRDQGVGLREGRAGPHDQRGRQAGDAPAVHRQDRPVPHVQRRQPGEGLECR